MRRVGLIAGLLLTLLAGCAGHRYTCDRSCVSTKLTERTGFALGPQRCGGQIVLPNGASLADGLTEDEAVLIALWNNAAFGELLSDLDIARGDLIQAGLLPNPEVVYFFPATEKPFKYAIDLPIEAFWLRPIRVASASRELARACDRLTQAALDLIRDVRQAYADVLLAKGQLRVAEEAVRIRGRIAELAQARLQAGDVSVQEAATAGIDALRTQEELVRTSYEVGVMEERLRKLLGIGADRSPLQFDDAPPSVWSAIDPDALAAMAIQSRPDALAAEQAVAAAAERVRLSRLGWVRLLGILDATSGKGAGHEFGPAFRVTLPIFNRNQGNIARAEAECEKAQRQRQTLCDQIILDVRQAHLRCSQARDELDVLQQRVWPEVEAAIRRAESAYREGDTTYVVVLETSRQLLDSHLRQEQLQAELRRAWAELERGVGRRLGASAPSGVGEEHAS